VHPLDPGDRDRLAERMRGSAPVAVGQGNAAAPTLGGRPLRAGAAFPRFMEDLRPAYQGRAPRRTSLSGGKGAGATAWAPASLASLCRALLDGKAGATRHRRSSCHNLLRSGKPRILQQGLLRPLPAPRNGVLGPGGPTKTTPDPGRCP